MMRVFKMSDHMFVLTTSHSLQSARKKAKLLIRHNFRNAQLDLQMAPILRFTSLKVWSLIGILGFIDHKAIYVFVNL